MKQAFLFILFCTLFGCRQKHTLNTGLEGKSLPIFNISQIDNDSNFNTSNIPTGKSIALFYFSPHCPFCRAQMEDIIENMDELKNIRFYLISNFPIPDLKHFCSAYNLPKYSNIVVATDPEYFFVNYFKSAAIPYIAIYGKDKTLNGVYVGLVKSSYIKDIASR